MFLGGAHEGFCTIIKCYIYDYISSLGGVIKYENS
ncbi:hypothetical protein OCEANICA350_12779 [Oceanicaulis sp. 350]|nr:hypothetical protein OCEANICA350_12779 [Oceanicaulis sp. 350]